jgi:hypothetical protein
MDERRRQENGTVETAWLSLGNAGIGVFWMAIRLRRMI